MYSVVLMMALAGGAEAPEKHNRGHGCTGGVAVASYGCTGYVGGYAAPVSYGCTGYTAPVSYGCTGYVASTGCTGGRHKLFGGHKHRSHGCTGTAVAAPYYGGCTGYVGGSAPYYGGCTGGIYGQPYVGGQPYMGQPDMGKPKEMIKPPVKDGKVPPEEVAAPATLVVNLPANAKLTVDGNATTSTSAVRTFVSPDLQPARDYSYTLTAEAVQNGNVVRVQRIVGVRAGQTTNVDFNFATSTATVSR